LFSIHTGLNPGFRGFLEGFEGFLKGFDLFFHVSDRISCSLRILTNPSKIPLANPLSPPKGLKVIPACFDKHAVKTNMFQLKLEHVACHDTTWCEKKFRHVELWKKFLSEWVCWKKNFKKKICNMMLWKKKIKKKFWWQHKNKFLKKKFSRSFTSWVRKNFFEIFFYEETRVNAVSMNKNKFWENFFEWAPM